MMLKTIVRDRRDIAKLFLEKIFSDRLSSLLAARNTTSSLSVSFWYTTKKYKGTSPSTIHGFILPNSEITTDSEKMCEVAASSYEAIFKEPNNIYHLHPYTDFPKVVWENYDEKIPATTFDEVLNIVQIRKKTKSRDAHDLNSSLAYCHQCTGFCSGKFSTYLFQARSWRINRKKPECFY